MKYKHSFGGAVWLIMIVFYYTIFLTSVYSAESVASTSAQDYQLIDNLNSIEQCQQPRYTYNADTGDKTETIVYTGLECIKSVGVLSEPQCNSIEGCNWENVTSGWWLWETTDDASCLGTINASYYNITTRTFLGFETVAPHENTNGLPSPCDAPSVIDNESLCNTFACTWGAYEEQYKKTNILSLIGELFTFSYSFSEDNATINYILTFIFVYVPFLILLVSIYFIVHPVK